MDTSTGTALLVPCNLLILATTSVALETNLGHGWSFLEHLQFLSLKQLNKGLTVNVLDGSLLSLSTRYLIPLSVGRASGKLSQKGF